MDTAQGIDPQKRPKSQVTHKGFIAEVETRAICTSTSNDLPTDHMLQLRSRAIKRLIRLVVIAGLVLALKPPYPHTAAAPISQNINNSQQAAQQQTVQAKTNETQPQKQEPSPQPPKPVVKSEPKPSIPTGGKYDWMAAAGISPADYAAVDYIISKESSWNPNATNAQSGAHGLPQALPYSKTNCGWTDAVCQLKWADNYAKSRYGGWWSAYNFWRSNHWW